VNKNNHLNEASAPRVERLCSRLGKEALGLGSSLTT